LIRCEALRLGSGGPPVVLGMVDAGPLRWTALDDVACLRGDPFKSQSCIYDAAIVSVTFVDAGFSYEMGGALQPPLSFQELLIAASTACVPLFDAWDGGG
jgi:hypothetical protein